MRRWQRIGMNAHAIPQLVINAAGPLPRLEDYSPGRNPSTSRSLGISHYALVVAMHYLEIDGTPGDDAVHFARRGAAVALDYFFGPWRDRFEYHGKVVEQLDAAGCRARLEWFDEYRNGLFCACVANDATALAELLKWPDTDLPYDGGAWDSPREENDFHVLMGLSLRGHKPAQREVLHAKIQAGRRRRAKLWLAALNALLARDSEALVASLQNLLAYHRKHEFRPNDPLMAVMIEGTIFYHLARQAKLRLPDLPEALADRIVTRETLCRN